MSYLPITSGGRPLSVSARIIFEQMKEILEYRSSLAPSGIGCTHSHLPGVVWRHTAVTVLDRNEEEYRLNRSEHDRQRPHLLQAYVAHPETRALAYIAFGKSGVEKMEEGEAPGKIEQWNDKHGIHHTVKKSYDAHHDISKSLRAATGFAANDPQNITLIKAHTDDAKNPHLFWHFLLHPQRIGKKPGDTFEYFSLVSPFPFYPAIQDRPRDLEKLKLHPLGEGISELDDLIGALHHYEPGLVEKIEKVNGQFFEFWGTRLIQFSEAIEHRNYAVPTSKSRRAIQWSLFQDEGAESPGEEREMDRNFMVENGPYTKQFYPQGACYNGAVLGKDHRSLVQIPIVDGNRNQLILPPNDREEFVGYLNGPSDKHEKRTSSKHQFSESELPDWVTNSSPIALR